MSKKSRIRNISKILTQANNNSDLLFYTPAKIGEHEMDGYIIDFFVNIKIGSIDPIPYVAPPSGMGLMNEAEKLQYFDISTESAPKKILSIYQQVENLTSLMTEITFFRDDPSYQEDIFPYLTRTNRIAIAYGTKILLRVRDFGSGLLAGEDELTFRAVVYEERELDIDYLAEKYLA